MYIFRIQEESSLFTNNYAIKPDAKQVAVSLEIFVLKIFLQSLKAMKIIIAKYLHNE